MGSIPITESSSVQERWDWFLEHLTPDNRKSLYVLAYRITRNPEDAEDVLQEALLQGAMHCHQLKNEDRLFQWMYSIVKRLANRYRIKSTNNLLEKLKELCIESARYSTLDDSALRSDERAYILAVIDRLKSPGKEIMKLKYNGESNLRVIAEQLGINYHTTRSAYQRARHEMIKELEAYLNEKE